MARSASTSTPSRRAVVKVAGVAAGRLVAPALLRVRPAYADYPDRPVKFVVANTRPSAYGQGSRICWHGLVKFANQSVNAIGPTARMIFSAQPRFPRH